MGGGGNLFTSHVALRGRRSESVYTRDPGTSSASTYPLSLSLSLSSPFLSFSSDRHTRVTLWGETIHIVNSIKTATSNMVAMIGTKSPGRKRQRAWLPPSVDRRLSNPLSRLNVPVYRIQLGPCYQGTNLDRQFRRRTEEWMSFDRIDRRPTTPK